MKQLCETYRLAIEGHPLPEGSSRLQRIAYGLGRRSAAMTVGFNERLDRNMRARFTGAVAHSEGVNRQALEVMQAAADIPHQASSQPLWGAMITTPQGRRLAQWNTRLSFGLDRDPSRPDKTPLMTALGSLRIEGAEWAPGGLIVPVDNLTIVSAALEDNNGNVGAAKTDIYINSRPSDFETLAAEVDSSKGVRLSIDPAGAITALAVTRYHINDYIDEDPTKLQVHLSEFLDGVQNAVRLTAQAYQGFPEGLA